MRVSDFTVDAERLWSGAPQWEAPLAFVDLDRTVPTPDMNIALPPCPVIGIGDAENPLASKLDAVVEAPVAAEIIASQVDAMPNAAAAIVQLLRILPELSPEAGLVAESMAYGMLQGSAEHHRWQARQAGDQAHPEKPGRIDLERDGAALVIMLNRPEAGNAIDRTMRDGLREAFTLASLDQTIKTVSLRARGKAFSLGADTTEFGTTGDPARAHAIRSRTLPANAVLGCADRLDVHIAGACIGAGLEIAAFAHRITGTPNSWYQLPELAMGILPGAGGCVSLVRRIGRQRAALMILSGKRLSARQALSWGLIDAIVDQPA